MRVHSEALISLKINDKAVILNDASSGGFGIYSYSLGDLAEIKNKMLNAKVEFNNKQFHLKIRNVHQHSDVWGFKIIEAPEDFTPHFHKTFTQELQAARLVPINTDKLKQEKEGRAHWYTDGRHSEVYFTVLQEELNYFHLIFHGNYFEFGEDQIPRLGWIRQDMHHNYGPQYPQSKMVQWYMEITEEHKQMLRDFVHGVPKLDNSLRSQILRKIEELSSTEEN